MTFDLFDLVIYHSTLEKCLEKEIQLLRKAIQEKFKEI